MPTNTTAISLSQIAESFAHPPKEYSPVPIWWWSGDRLERERMRWQMQQLIAGGVYNVVILNLAPTSPLYGADPDQPAFMSDEWWAIFLGVCADAREIGMRIWFYDQIGFSGANLQGELVRAEPSFAGQSLTAATVEGEGRLELECPFEGTPLAAAYVPLNADGSSGAPVTVPLDGRKAATDAPGSKRLRLIYAIQRGFDYFNAAACDRLLDTVHREFERRARQFFGDVIVGSFQDELPTLPSWGAGFAEGFRALKGYDLRDQLIALFEGEDDQSESVRRDYHEARALLAEQTFFKPFFDWHRQFGLVCGFDQQGPARAGEPIGGVRLYADYLQTHRWYDAPGSDHHGNAKIHSSLAHLYDRPRVWIESFHSSGWGGTLEETFDWLLPWLRAGATLYNPHAVYYGTWGGWWEWAPPSTCWRQPYWRHYSLFANAVSRLCYLLSQGSHVCDIGVLYPSTTIQAGLTVEKALPDAEAANHVYETLVGRMMFMEFDAGVLDADRRDFDVIDEDSLQNASIIDGEIAVAAERFPVLILPACAVLEAATAAQLIRFVEGGGRLFAVGSLPRHVLGGSPDALNQLFASGRATFVASPDDLPAALSIIARRVESPVPVLQRRIGASDVIFVPAAFPHASRSESAEANWLKADYSFDPARYAQTITLRLRGASGTPHLWDALTGERRALASTVDGSTVAVEIPFEAGPAALVVFSDEIAASPAVPPADDRTLYTFPDVWSCRLEPTLDNRYGDFTKPNAPGAPPVQTWTFEHAIAPEPPSEDAWQTVRATFGAHGEWSPLDAEDWRPAVYSLSRGIRKDALHVPTLGPKGHVPEEFLDFGTVAIGGGVRFRTAVWMDTPRTVTLALGAPARKEAWINGQSLGGDSPGYLWQTPVQLNAGLNPLEFSLFFETGGDLRAYWALVTDPARFARPERMTGVDAPRRDSRLRFSLSFDIPFDPVEFTVQVSADSPCRVTVNDVEAGRQGGFDPYASLARVQPYTVRSGRQGSNTIVLDVQDIGAVAAALADGLIRGANGEMLSITSGSHWTVQRDDGAVNPVALIRRQWLDPAWSHLWRRPHPLPGAMWLEDKPADKTVLPIVPVAGDQESRIEWFRWTLPPGATEIHLPVAGAARLWVDGVSISIDGRKARVAPSGRAERVALLRVEPERGRTGGGIFTAPVTYTMADGKIRLGDWGERGLEAYSGALRLWADFTLPDAPTSALALDLGRVRGTAEVWVNGQPVGARFLSPYRFDISGAARPGQNRVEILVTNTLAPYLDAVSPTHYVRPGQTVSGVLGAVRILAGKM